MTIANAAKSGSFQIGGDLAVHRLGFGAMRIVGKGVWGEPEARDEALRTLRRVPELGINLIDTADSYGPEISERLIREALHPYKGLVIATKGGLLRPGPDALGAVRQARLSAPAGVRQPAPARGRAYRPLAAAPHRSRACRAPSSSTPSPPCRRKG